MKLQKIIKHCRIISQFLFLSLIIIAHCRFNFVDCSLPSKLYWIIRVLSFCTYLQCIMGKYSEWILFLRVLNLQWYRKIRILVVWKKNDKYMLFYEWQWWMTDKNRNVIRYFYQIWKYFYEIFCIYLSTFTLNFVDLLLYIFIFIVTSCIYAYLYSELFGNRKLYTSCIMNHTNYLKIYKIFLQNHVAPICFFLVW